MSENVRDLYTRITAKICADLEQGVRPWLKPWNAEHAAGRITRPCAGTAPPIAASISWCCGRLPSPRAMAAPYG